MSNSVGYEVAIPKGALAFIDTVRRLAPHELVHGWWTDPLLLCQKTELHDRRAFTAQDLIFFEAFKSDPASAIADFLGVDWDESS